MFHDSCGGSPQGLFFRIPSLQDYCTVRGMRTARKQAGAGLMSSKSQELVGPSDKGGSLVSGQGRVRDSVLQKRDSVGCCGNVSSECEFSK